MRTIRQIQASRANGARSQGPKTPEGKATSALNHTLHGLAGRTVVLTTESRERFEHFLQDFLDLFQPQSLAEFTCVEEMAMAKWRLRRSIAFETAQLDHELAATQQHHNETYAQIDLTTRSALAMDSLLAKSPAFRHLSRYEASHRRAFRRAYEELLALRHESENRKIPFEPNTPQTEDPLP